MIFLLLAWQCVAAAPCDGPDLFRRLRVEAAGDPARAFACAPSLATDAQRDFIQRLAFQSAAVRDPKLAADHLPGLVSRPWITGAGFLPLRDVARLAPVESAQQLMLAAARHNPSLALRELDAYAALPFGGEVFSEAVRSAPDEAAGLAARNPALRNALGSHGFRTLAALAADDSLGASQRERVAVFYEDIGRGGLSLSRARQMAEDDNFFPALVRRRIGATGAEAMFLDRVLTRTASILFRWFEDRQPRIAHLGAVELYLLLALGRSEEDDKLFTPIFDGLLLPKLRGAELPELHLRRFLAACAQHRRLDAILRAAGPAALARALGGIESLEDALEASEFIESVNSVDVLARLRTAIDARSGVFYGLLAARIAEKMNERGWPLATRYAPYLTDTSHLSSSSLFNTAGLCIERHVFHSDDDGEESFESFRRHYQADPAWIWEDHGSWVRVSGGPVVIYANKPVGDGQQEISRLFAAAQVEPSVFVHRGHSYHVERSLGYLTSSARLVFLGSCRGLTVTAGVIAAAPEAQMIVTNAVGTAGVNDPLLKAINDELRKGAKSIDWPSFWKAQEIRFGRAPVFEDYIPPHRNAGARFAAAYYSWLAS